MGQLTYPSNLETAVDAIADTDVAAFQQPSTVAGVRTQKKNLMSVFRTYFQTGVLNTRVTYDLSSADIIHALPTAVGFTERIIIKFSGGVPASKELSFTTVSGQTIDGDAASVWLGQGEGIIIFYSDDANWQIEVYEDSGSNANGDWKKLRDGVLECRDTDTSGVLSFTFTFALSPVNATYFVYLTGGDVGAKYAVWNGTPVKSVTSISGRWSATPTDANVFLDFLMTGKWK